MADFVGAQTHCSDCLCVYTLWTSSGTRSFISPHALDFVHERFIKGFFFFFKRRNPDGCCCQCVGFLLCAGDDLHSKYKQTIGERVFHGRQKIFWQTEFKGRIWILKEIQTTKRKEVFFSEISLESSTSREIRGKKSSSDLWSLFQAFRLPCFPAKFSFGIQFIIINYSPTDPHSVAETVAGELNDFLFKFFCVILEIVERNETNKNRSCLCYLHQLPSFVSK